MQTPAYGVRARNHRLPLPVVLGALVLLCSGHAWAARAGFEQVFFETHFLYREFNGFDRNDALSAMLRDDQTLLFAGDRGVLRLAAGRLTRVGEAMRAWTLFAPKPGAVWVGGEQGLFALGKAGLVNVEQVRIPVAVIARDPQQRGRYLLGGALGLWRYQPGRRVRQLRGEPVGALAAHKRLLFVGSDNGLFARDGGKWRQWRNLDGLPSNVVLSLAVDRRARLWVGTRRGLCHTAPLGATLPRELGFRCDAGVRGAVTALSVDTADRIWAADSQALWVSDGRRLLRVGAIHGRPDLPIRQLFIDQGTLYAMSQRGYARLPLARWPTLLTALRTSADFERINALALAIVPLLLFVGGAWLGVKRRAFWPVLGWIAPNLLFAIGGKVWLISYFQAQSRWLFLANLPLFLCAAVLPAILTLRDLGRSLLIGTAERLFYGLSTWLFFVAGAAELLLICAPLGWSGWIGLMLGYHVLVALALLLAAPRRVRTSSAASKRR